MLCSDSDSLTLSPLSVVKCRTYSKSEYVTVYRPIWVRDGCPGSVTGVACGQRIGVRGVRGRGFYSGGPLFFGRQFQMRKVLVFKSNWISFNQTNHRYYNNFCDAFVSNGWDKMGRLYVAVFELQCNIRYLTWVSWYWWGVFQVFLIFPDFLSFPWKSECKQIGLFFTLENPESRLNTEKTD